MDIKINPKYDPLMKDWTAWDVLTLLYKGADHLRFAFARAGNKVLEIRALQGHTVDQDRWRLPN